jgi:uncharacterized protein with von Willebrand factor type A (vWA) domain
LHLLQSRLNNQPDVEPEHQEAFLSELKSLCKGNEEQVTRMESMLAGILEEAVKKGVEKANEAAAREKEAVGAAVAASVLRKEKIQERHKNNNNKRARDEEDEEPTEEAGGMDSLAQLAELQGEVKALNKERGEGAKERLHSICKFVVSLPDGITKGKEHEALDKWRRRTALWNRQFQNCIDVCHKGDASAFYSAEFKQMAWTKKPICNCKIVEN